jgi:thiamine-phosphate pyrophosphorylase
LTKETHYRIIDANLNRLKEGIRVVEDIIRYEFDNKNIVLILKNIRHSCIIEDNLKYLSFRDTKIDCLKDITLSSEITKTSIKNIILSNIKRAQESARVLEEMFKLYSHTNSEIFKDVRYRLYSVEKEIFDIVIL